MRKKRKNKKGFSLTEMLVAMFIFTLIMLASVASFTSMNSYRKKTKEAQERLEESRVALEIMSKDIRMSTNLDEKTAGVEISMYSNSQSKCIYYKFNGTNGLQRGEKDPTTAGDPSTCPGTGSVSYYSLVKGITGEFDVTETGISPKQIGKVTAVLTVGDHSLQTTVSLREYQDIIQ